MNINDRMGDLIHLPEVSISMQNQHMTSHGPAQQVKDGEANLGTSIMAVEFEGGVVVGADSRVSVGSYISNRVCNKLSKIHDQIYCCRSGSAADTEAVCDYVTKFLVSHSHDMEEAPTVQTAAALFQMLCYDNKNFLSAGIICAGWDRRNGGSVYSVPIGGALVRQPFAIGGSGSTYIYGYCDAHYKQGMSRNECVDFVKRSLSLAMSRDGSSGGIINIAVIDANGVEKEVVLHDKLPYH